MSAAAEKMLVNHEVGRWPTANVNSVDLNCSEACSLPREPSEESLNV